MNKIPVGQTIARSYGFAFGRYFSVLGVVWLPLVLCGVIDFFLIGSVLKNLHLLFAPNGVLEHPEVLRAFLLVELAGLVTILMVTVGITKEALGIRGGPRFVYLWFGAAEFRLIGAYLALILLMIVFMIVLGLLGGIIAAAVALAVGAAMGSHNEAVGPVILGLTGLAILIEELALLYIAVRLTFLLVPVTIAEKRIGILRSWELTSGNFWRIFVIMIAVTAPLIVLILFAEFTLFFPLFKELAARPRTQDPAAVGRAVTSMIEFYRPYALYILPISVLLTPLVYGLTLSPAAFAYRALVPLPVEDKPVAPMQEVKAEGPHEDSKPDADLPGELQEILEPEKPDHH